MSWTLEKQRKMIWDSINDCPFFELMLFVCSLKNNSLFYDRYSMVLADNIDGGDDLDLIVATMNGNVFCFSTPSPHHPLKVVAEHYYCLFSILLADFI